MINTQKLKKRIKKCGLTQSAIADRIGISNALLSMKIRNRRAMTLCEAEAISEILGICDNEFSEYFLLKIVAQRNKNLQ